MDLENVEEPQGEDKASSWADVVADVAPRPGVSFADLLSWTLDLAESSDQLSERDCAEFRKAVAEHMTRFTGNKAEKLMGVLRRLFAIAHRRAPGRRPAPGANGAHSREVAPGLEEAAARMCSALFR